MKWEEQGSRQRAQLVLKFCGGGTMAHGRKGPGDGRKWSRRAAGDPGAVGRVPSLRSLLGQHPDLGSTLAAREEHET